MLCGRGWPTWCGKRTPVATADRRTIGELLAESDALARETLLDATLERAWADRGGYPPRLSAATQSGTIRERFSYLRPERPLRSAAVVIWPTCRTNACARRQSSTASMRPWRCAA
jgi:hypothetical protein